jgi:putative transposase
VDWAIKEKHYSQRRACALIGMAPKTYRYVGKRDEDAVVRERLRALASERRRFAIGGCMSCSPGKGCG